MPTPHEDQSASPRKRRTRRRKKKLRSREEPLASVEQQAAPEEPVQSRQTYGYAEPEGVPESELH